MDEHGLPIVGAGVDYSKVSNKEAVHLSSVLRSGQPEIRSCSPYLQVPALDHKNTLVFLNKFIMNTAQFLNKFSTVCEEVGCLANFWTL